VQGEPLGGLVVREGMDRREEREVVAVVQEERAVVGSGQAVRRSCGTGTGARSAAWPGH